MDVIDAYIAELDGALRGPKRARTDLLTEARDSLVDATETFVGSLGAALACGIGVRYLRTWHRPARVTGIFTLTVASLLVVLGLLLTLVNPQPVPLLHAGGLAWVTVFLLIPMMGVALSARRCLRTAYEQARS